LLDKKNIEDQIALKQQEIDLNQAAIDDATAKIEAKEAAIAKRKKEVEHSEKCNCEKIQ
jgi:hypothetical protein